MTGTELDAAFLAKAHARQAARQQARAMAMARQEFAARKAAKKAERARRISRAYLLTAPAYAPLVKQFRAQQQQQQRTGDTANGEDQRKSAHDGS